MSKRYLEIYSGRRDRQQYPSPANFVIPFGTSSEVKDPVLNGAIYYQWIMSPIVDYGTIMSSTNKGTLTLKSSVSTSTVINAYKGYILDINQNVKNILTYNPTTSTVTVESGFYRDLTGSTYKIYSTFSGSIYVDQNFTGIAFYIQSIPYQDKFENQILEKEQAYTNYYIMNETTSNGTYISGRKIYDYNYNLRYSYSSDTVNDGISSHFYTIRKSLPLEKWNILTPVYINTDSSYGPLGPVITLPKGSSTIDNYYVGKYVYFASNQPTSHIESKFKPVYGSFRIKASKLLPTLENELFVDYDKNERNLLPNGISNQGTIIEYGWDDNLQIQFIQLSNFTTETPNTSLYVGLTFLLPLYDNGYGDIGASSTILKVGYFLGKYGIFISGFTPGVINVGDSYTIINNVINIVSLQRDNASNLDYIGTMVSVNQANCYDIELIELILPNTPLLNGTITSTYPFVYVHLKNVSSPTNVSPSTIYSNNPPSTDALFVVLITDITDPTTSKFVRIKCSTTIRVKFKPNDSLHFSVTLPDGSYVTPAQPDYFSPYEPNPDLQIHATFGIKPV